MSQKTCVVMGRIGLALALVLPFLFVAMGKSGSAIVAAVLSRRASISSPDYVPPPLSGSIALFLGCLEGIALVYVLAAVATHC